MSSSQWHNRFFTPMMLTPTYLAKADGTILRPKPQRTYSLSFPFASQNAVRYLPASWIVNCKTFEARSKQEKYAD